MNCPICKKPVDPPEPDQPSHLPFCSERCKLIDLGRWLKGSYQIPLDNPDEDLSLPPDEDTLPS